MVRCWCGAAVVGLRPEAGATVRRRSGHLLLLLGLVSGDLELGRELGVGIDAQRAGDHAAHALAEVHGVLGGELVAGADDAREVQRDDLENGGRSVGDRWEIGVGKWLARR